MTMIHIPATNFRNAFILNAVAVATITVLTVTTKGYFDRLYSVLIPQFKHSRLRSIMSIASTFLMSFIIAFSTYFILNKITGFGGGMLSACEKVKCEW